MHRRTVALGLLAGLLLVALPSRSVEAHVRRPPTADIAPVPAPEPPRSAPQAESRVWVAGAVSPTAPWAAMAILGSALLFRVGRRRRVVAVALVVVLALFAAEGALHSVHALLDPDHAANCPLYAAWQHAPSGTAAVPAVDPRLDPATTLEVWLPAPSLRAPFLRPDQGRAPPVFAA